MPVGVYARISGQELKDRLADIVRMQNLSFQEKISAAMTIMRDVDRLAAPGKRVVMFSGGRDSTVAALLARRLWPDVSLLYNDTGLGTPGSSAQVERIAGKLQLPLTITRPGVTAFEMWRSRGHFPIGPKRGHTFWKQKRPGLKSSPVQCCYHLKEVPAKQALKSMDAKVLVWGNRADDSNRRKLALADHGFIQKPCAKWPVFNVEPLAFFLDDDIRKILEQTFPGEAWVERGETGCACCCTDISRPDNQLSRLFLRDKPAFLAAIRSGLGEQLLTANGYHLTVEEALEKDPRMFLRVNI
ncbi:MAG: phosphoadenosine phosphosulfate reductase family protein [Magnetococcales bacterium]|nr:phosphoadenosine phosphosulfate reductase family protein [Magnetococcales bacterium]